MASKCLQVMESLVSQRPLEKEKPASVPPPLQMGVEGRRTQAPVSPGQKPLPVLNRRVLSLGSWEEGSGEVSPGS